MFENDEVSLKLIGEFYDWGHNDDVPTQLFTQMELCK